uniref:Uncharacterized protein n=1 Tax=viral metagenome TaxID=1070528 RepID=A0A6M3XHE5_9ZZZZ
MAKSRKPANMNPGQGQGMASAARMQADRAKQMMEAGKTGQAKQANNWDTMKQLRQARKTTRGSVRRTGYSR